MNVIPYVIVPLPKTSSLPVLTNLSSLTLNWRREPNVDIDDSLPEFLSSASDLIWEQLRWVPCLQDIAIQLHHDHLRYERQWSPKWYTSLLRRPVAIKSTRTQYHRLERALARLRLQKNLVALYLSEWSQSASSVLRSSLRRHLDGLLTVEVHGGTVV